MKLKKSIPMFIAILTIILIATIININGLINDLNIETTNKYIYSAVNNSIIFTCFIQTCLFYYGVIYILKFKQYLIIQNAKTSIRNIIKKAVKTVDSSVKDLVNDKGNEPINNLYEDKLKQAKKSFDNDAKEFSERFKGNLDFSKSNEDFVKKENNILSFTDFRLDEADTTETRKAYYFYLNKEYNNTNLITNSKWKELWLNCKPKRLNNEILSVFNSRLYDWTESLPMEIKDFIINNRKSVIVEEDLV